MCMPVVVRPKTLASLLCRDGARRVSPTRQTRRGGGALWRSGEGGREVNAASGGGEGNDAGMGWCRRGGVGVARREDAR